MFSDEFRQRLALGKYARWAVDLTEQHLEALIWTVGEYGVRAPIVLKLLDEHKNEFSVHDEAFARVRLALESIACFVNGERPDLERIRSRVVEVLAQARSLTDDEWPSHREDPFKMLSRLPDPTSKRKCRLFSVAFCRRVWHLFGDDCCRRAVEIAELYADGLATEKELAAARVVAEAAANSCEMTRGHSVGRAAFLTALADPDPVGVADITAMSMGVATTGSAEEPDQSDHGKWLAYHHGKCREHGVQCDLIRDVFGNPFRPVTIARGFLTSTVLALAQAAYDERTLPAGTLDNARLAVLADALEDAGCDNADILNHCRSEGPHTRGCWALDLILAKS